MPTNDAAIVTVDSENFPEQESNDTPELPSKKRRRLKGKQTELRTQEHHEEVGRGYLMPQILRLPLVMGCLSAALMVIAPPGLDEPLDGLEIFSGVGEIVKGFLHYGLKAMGVDKIR